MELKSTSSPGEEVDGATSPRSRPSPLPREKMGSTSRGPAPHICEARGHSEADLATCGRLLLLLLLLLLLMLLLLLTWPPAAGCP